MDKLINEELVISNLEKEFRNNKKKIITKSKPPLITEGIKYFKNSIRLRKVADKIKNNAEYVEDADKKETLVKTAARMYTLANDFEKVELDYSSGNTYAKKDYNNLLIKYKDVCKMLKRETVKSALKSASVLVLSIASMALSYLAINKLKINGLKGTSTTKEILADIPNSGKTETNSLSVSDGVKRMGIFYLMGLPFIKIKSMVNNSIDNTQTQDDIIKTIEKTFPELRDGTDTI